MDNSESLILSVELNETNENVGNTFKDSEISQISICHNLSKIRMGCKRGRPP